MLNGVITIDMGIQLRYCLMKRGLIEHQDATYANSIKHKDKSIKAQQLVSINLCGLGTSSKTLTS